MHSHPSSQAVGSELWLWPLWDREPGIAELVYLGPGRCVGSLLGYLLPQPPGAAVGESRSGSTLRNPSSRGPVWSPGSASMGRSPCCSQTWAVHALWVSGTVWPSMDKCEAEAGVVPDPTGKAPARLLLWGPGVGGGGGETGLCWGRSP